MKKVVYIGTKPMKADNVAKTGLIWNRGDIHEVKDDKAADFLLEHKDVWANADQPYEMASELTLVKSESPKAIFKQEFGNMDNFVLDLPDEIILKLHNKELVPIFMRPEDADEFETWKLDRDTAPKITGPQVEREPAPKKRGLEKRA